MQKTILKLTCLLLFLTSLPVFAEGTKTEQTLQETNVLQTEEDQSKDENVEQLELTTEEKVLQDQGTKQDVFLPEEETSEINNPQNEETGTEESSRTDSSVPQSEQEETKNEADIFEEGLSTNKIDMSLIEDEVLIRIQAYTFLLMKVYTTRIFIAW